MIKPKPKPGRDEVKTLVVDNFSGIMTAYLYGDINSGRSFVISSGGQNPFIKPRQLTWSEPATQIDPDGTIIQGLILDAKERVEDGILYVYAIDNNARLYKIQVNDPTTFDPNYDNPTLVTTLSPGTTDFTRGGFLEFFGSPTQKIYIGHGKSVTSINFDGTGETQLSGTWTQTVPRPLCQFLGKLYAGNGENIAEIDSTGTVTSSTKLSPSFPGGTQVRDIDVLPDGNYIEVVVTRLPLGDITSGNDDVGVTSNSESYLFLWNGVDAGYTSSNMFPSFSLNANTTFQDYHYIFGYDQFGAAIFNPTQKIFFASSTPSAMPNAINSTGNLLTWFTPLYFDGVLEADLLVWGSLDFEIGQPLGWWDIFWLNATGTETDIAALPFQMSVSNANFGPSTDGYPNNQFGTSKIYFSTLETSATTSKAKLYRWSPTADSTVSNQEAFIGAYYQTQSKMFSKKILVKEVRIYGEPWVADNSFTIDLIGSSNTPISNGSRTFTAGSNLEIGEDRCWYNPETEPTYALGIGITNGGEINHTINKIEIDYSGGGE